MTLRDWRQLAVVSVTNPGEAAQSLMAMHIPVRALWTALVLVAIGNTMLFTLSDQLFQAPSPLPQFFSIPFVNVLVVAIWLVLMATSIYWVGGLLGGKGTLADILVLVVWMQALRVVVQVAVLVLMFVVPILSGLLVLAAAVIGVYMLVHFIDQAHRLGSPGRAAAVLIASVLAIVVGISVLIVLVGGPNIGSTLNI